MMGAFLFEFTSHAGQYFWTAGYKNEPAICSARFTASLFSTNARIALFDNMTGISSVQKSALSRAIHYDIVPWLLHARSPFRVRGYC